MTITSDTESVTFNAPDAIAQKKFALFYAKSVGGNMLWVRFRHKRGRRELALFDTRRQAYKFVMRRKPLFESGAMIMHPNGRKEMVFPN